MAFDQGMDRLQGDSRVPDQVCQRGEAQINAFTRKALCLPVQRLVLSVFFEDQHCDQAGSGPSARNRMERRRRLANLLAGPASELLAHSLDHLPLTWDYLQRLGDVLAHLHDPVRATASAGGRCLNNNPLARLPLIAASSDCRATGDRGTACARDGGA